MRKYNSEKPLFHIHIPKSAGTTFNKVLDYWFDKNLCPHYFDEENNKMPVKYDLKPHLCIHGHFNKKRGFGVFDYYPGAEQFTTIIREPIELHLSNYFYVKKNVIKNENYRAGFLQDFKWKTVDDYLEKTNSFLLLHFPWELTAYNFKEILEMNFIHIGIMENLQESIAILAKRLGKKNLAVGMENVSPRTETPSPNAIARWKERHRLEYALYEYVKMLSGPIRIINP